MHNFVFNINVILSGVLLTEGQKNGVEESLVICRTVNYGRSFDSVNFCSAKIHYAQDDIVFYIWSFVNSGECHA
jgi:hypothetical protein